MKKLIIGFILIACSLSSGKAQIIWQDNIEAAVNLAKVSNRLIVIDFWATWCGPCREMDKDVWAREEIKEIADRFVFAKVDIDYNRIDAMSFGIKSIPSIFIVDVERNEIYNIKGYKDLEYMLDVFKQFPDDMARVYERLSQLNTWEDHLDISVAFLSYAQDIEDHRIKRGFVSAASNHLRKADKMVKGNPAREETVEIYQIVTLAQFNGKKAIKKLDKLYEDSTGENEDLFNYAYCCGLLEEGNIERARKYYDELLSSNRNDLASRLENRID